ncbi:hypothetical protein ACFLRQ_02725 [Bacteroidota bacterium]
MKIKKIYYAHSKQFYDTVREMNEYAFLYDYYSPHKVINPAHLDYSGMKKYLEVVSQCDTLVASELDGYIGKGVFSELARAMSDGIKVEVLRKEGNKYGKLITK